MVWRILLLVNLLVAPIRAIAQSADEYFHHGAQYYIFGEKDKAKTEILTGLQMYPTDPKLNAVAQLLKKKESQEDQKNSKKDQKQQNQKDQQQQSGKQDQKQDQKSEQQKKDQEKAQQEQAKKDQEKKDQQAQANPSDQRDKGEQKNDNTAMAQVQMSPQEARQLLDAQQNDEKVLIFTPDNQPIKPQPGKFKDW
jgi:outer membrane biosynthesis protein TonB